MNDLANTDLAAEGQQVRYNQRVLDTLTKNLVFSLLSFFLKLTFLLGFFEIGDSFIFGHCAEES